MGQNSVEIGPDGQDTDEQDQHNRTESVRETVRTLIQTFPRPSLPNAQDAAYAYVVVLLFASPAVAIAGGTWTALVSYGIPAALVVFGLSATAYAIFLMYLLVQTIKGSRGA